MLSVVVALCAVLLLLAGIGVWLFAEGRRRRLGSLRIRAIYEDTQQQPATVLVASTLPLHGKPDYLLKKAGMIIPVEVKTGKTPHTPYRNHVMQLLAYCLLVEETYHIRPTHGVIKYPEQEFTVPYSAVEDQALRGIVAEIVSYKANDKDFDVSRSRTYLCRECRVAMLAPTD